MSKALGVLWSVRNRLLHRTNPKGFWCCVADQQGCGTWSRKGCELIIHVLRRASTPLICFPVLFARTVQPPRHNHSEWGGHRGCSNNHGGVHASLHSDPLCGRPPLFVPDLRAPHQLPSVHGQSCQPSHILKAEKTLQHSVIHGLYNYMLKYQYHKGKFIVILANTKVSGIKRKHILSTGSCSWMDSQQ